MKKHFTYASSWVICNQTRLRLMITMLLLALMLTALLAPGLVSLADNVPSTGGHTP
jgi:hypothetical protein